MSFVGRFISVASRRWCLVSFFRLVFRFVARLVLFFALFIVPFCFCLNPWREAVRVGRGVDVLVVMWSGRWCSVPVFLIGLTGEGHEVTGVCCLIQLILIHIHGAGSCSWRDDIDMGRSKGTMREAIDNGKNVIAAGGGVIDGGRDAIRDEETRRMSDNETDGTRRRGRDGWRNGDDDI